MSSFVYPAAAVTGTTFPLLADAGTAALPSYSFTGDADTGIYQVAADVLGFSVAGAGRFVMSNTDINVSANMNMNFLSGTAVIKLFNTAGTYGATLRGNASQSVNTVFQLPPTNGSSGQVLQTDGSGITSWVTSSGANTTLSNLGTTNINANLLFNADLTYTIGAPTERVSIGYIRRINDENDNSILDGQNRELVDDVGNAALGFSSGGRALFDDVGDISLEWDAADRIVLSKALRIHRHATGPGTPLSGDLFYDTDVNKLKFYNGSTWETITST